MLCYAAVSRNPAQPNNQPTRHLVAAEPRTRGHGGPRDGAALPATGMGGGVWASLWLLHADRLTAAVQVFRLDAGGRVGVTTLDITKTGLALDMLDTAMFTLLCKLVCMQPPPPPPPLNPHTTSPVHTTGAGRRWAD
jgi:hypothetical protein